MNLYAINSIRTNNFKDEQIMSKIQTMWEEAFRQLGKYRGNVYGLYYDYQSNYRGDYSLSVAIEEDRGGARFHLPNHDRYEVFKVDTADEQGLLKAWSKIWDQEEAGLLKRTYSCDFEKYYPAGEVEIYIAIH